MVGLRIPYLILHISRTFFVHPAIADLTDVFGHLSDMKSNMNE